MNNGRRPLRILILVVLSIGMACWNGLRLVQSLISWSILSEYHLMPSPQYVAVSGGFWLLINLVILFGLIRGAAWSLYAYLAGMIGYFTWYWLDRLMLQLPHSNIGFSLGISMAYLIFGIIMLFSFRTKLHFTGFVHERKIKN